MSNERKDLVAILKALAVTSSDEIEKLEQGETNIELLRKIVHDLERLQTNRKLDDKQLPDSMAFPKETRNKLDLSASTKLWDELKNFNNLLRQDYTCRRQMLISRLDCTVESFKWKSSSHQKERLNSDDNSQESNQNQSIDRIFKERGGTALNAEPKVSISHLLALRETQLDHLLNEVVSSKTDDCMIEVKQRVSSSQPTHVYLKRFAIPDVPDRGGRPDETKAPTKETFFQQRRSRGRR